ncbi:MAG: EamA family transporter [Candidatus Micrarchaeota archaeon]|nr:EamA family transporter [Candidatus Micrarchaeota archaeon]MDE1859213.1 EamA family transporter [Candidatus Micrarchaeota archaeon]
MLSSIEVILLTLVAAAIVAYAQYTFKRSIHKFRFDAHGVLSLLSNRTVMLGMLVYLVGLVFYLLALGSGQLSFVYPAFSSTFIFVMLISHYKLGEKVGYGRLAGILLIIAGIAMVSFG